MNRTLDKAVKSGIKNQSQMSRMMWFCFAFYPRFHLVILNYLFV